MNNFLKGLVAAVVLLMSTSCTGTSSAVDGGEKPLDSSEGDSATRPRNPFVWAVSAGGKYHDTCHGIAVDGAGNSFISGGHYYSPATFGSLVLTAETGTHVFVAKLDGSGKFVWAVPVAGIHTSTANAIAVDTSGSSYITGYFGSSATFGSMTLTSKGGSYDIFVAKLDAGGKFIWAVPAGGTRWDDGASIALDGSGNSYITGHFEGTAAFGSTTLTSRGSWDIFVAKLDRRGDFVWAVSAGGTDADHSSSIAVDSSGSCYITDYFRGIATFGNTILTSRGSYEMFLAKLNSSGQFVWAVSAGGAAQDGALSVVLDRWGNSYITGSFEDRATFGNTVLTSRGKIDAYVAKVDGLGRFVWATSAGGTMLDTGFSIALDGAGNSYVTGSFSQGTATFGSTTLTSSGNIDAFVAKVDGNGKFAWAVSAGGGWPDAGYSIAVDGGGNAYLAGGFEGSADFGTTRLISAGNRDIFVAKIDSRWPYY